MIKLVEILNELNVPKSEDAYPLTGPETSTNGNLMINKYRFKNRKGDDMTVAANFDTRDEELYVVFYKTGEEETDDDEKKYGSETGSGDMLKVLATVVEAVNRTVKNLGGMEKVRRIHIEPADQRRFNIYMHYAQTLFPDFVVKKAGSWMIMLNKNYKPREL
jgi:hypothetical protein